MDYAKLQSSQGSKGLNLIADLDEHSDWVNQVKLIEEVNTLISCSNDTTIRIWRYKSNESYERRNNAIRSNNRISQRIYRQQAFSTFQDHEDYVRSIDYSKNLGRLFSASDDGKVFLWDLHAEKLM